MRLRVDDRLDDGRRSGRERGSAGLLGARVGGLRRCGCVPLVLLVLALGDGERVQPAGVALLEDRGAVLRRRLRRALVRLAAGRQQPTAGSRPVTWWPVSGWPRRHPGPLVLVMTFVGFVGAYNGADELGISGLSSPGCSGSPSRPGPRFCRRSGSCSSVRRRSSDSAPRPPVAGALAAVTAAVVGVIGDLGCVVRAQRAVRCRAGAFVGALHGVGARTRQSRRLGPGAHRAQPASWCSASEWSLLRVLAVASPRRPGAVRLVGLHP